MQILMNEQNSQNEQQLLWKLVLLLRQTFIPMRRRAKHEQTILLSKKSAAVLEANPATDGLAGSALLTELRMRLGLDVAPCKEQLKVLLLQGLCIAKLPLWSLVGRKLTLIDIRNESSVCASLKVSGQPPSIDALLTLTLSRSRLLPSELLIKVQDFAGNLWWGRKLAVGGLPCLSEQLTGFSAKVPRTLVKSLRSLVCFPCTHFSFSHGSDFFVQWDGEGELWMRGATVALFITLLRCERSDVCRQGPAAVFSVRGAGDVLV
jgi:hypothetical protein